MDENEWKKEKKQKKNEKHEIPNVLHKIQINAII